MTKQIKKMKLVFHTDPGHGWLRVPRNKMKLLPLPELEKISHYSYQTHTGSNFYLEEDMDAGIFLNWAKSEGYEIEIKESSSGNKESHVRDLPSFSKDYVL